MMTTTKTSSSSSSSMSRLEENDSILFLNVGMNPLRARAVGEPDEQRNNPGFPVRRDDEDAAAAMVLVDLLTLKDDSDNDSDEDDKIIETSYGPFTLVEQRNLLASTKKPSEQQQQRGKKRDDSTQGLNKLVGARAEEDHQNSKDWTHLSTIESTRPHKRHRSSTSSGTASTSLTCSDSMSSATSRAESEVVVPIDDEDEEIWDEHYYQLALFKATKNHTRLPLDYVCKDDYYFGSNKKVKVFYVGQWLVRQRAALLAASAKAERNNKVLPTLVQGRIQKLNDIGFGLNEDDDRSGALSSSAVLTCKDQSTMLPQQSPSALVEKCNNGMAEKKNYKEKLWDEYFKLLIDYKKENQHLRVPTKYETKHGVKLGQWVQDQRNKLKLCLDKEGKVRITTDAILRERCVRLTSIDFPWVLRTTSKPVAWDVYYQLALSYKEEHQHLFIPANYITPGTGIKLGQWAYNQRASYSRKRRMEADGKKDPASRGQYNISQERIDKLNQIEFEWKGERNKIRSFEDYYNLVLAYKEEHHHLCIPQKYETVEGIKIGQWVSQQRLFLKPHIDKKEDDIVSLADKVKQERIRRLNNIGFQWEVQKGRRRVDRR